MFDLKKYEGKSKDDLLKKITEELNCNEDELVILENFTEGKLFKAQKYELSIITKSQIKEDLRKFFKELGRLINITIEAEINLVEDEIYNVNLITSNNPTLIGREGKTVESLQYLIRQVIQNKLRNKIKVNIDISNYKLDKNKKFEKNIKNIAREVQRSKIDVSLDPMNSYNRRIVHTIVDEFSNLETESIGEGKERHVVIKYVEK